MAEEDHRFGILRSLFWPVHRSEVKKVVSMLGMLFLLCITYSILRNLKDTLVLTAKHSGAVAIPFLKMWGILPGAIIATWLYTRLTRMFSKENVFYIVVSGFLLYFLLFAFLLYPNSERLHLDTLGDWLTTILPVGCKGGIAVIRNWSFTSFYVISELWSVVVLIVLFWGFANDITEVSQAKRTYGLLNVGSNVAPIFGGSIGIMCRNMFSFPFLGADAWKQTLANSMLTVTFFGVLSMVLFYWINRKVVTSKVVRTSNDTAVVNNKKKLSVRESIRYISRSKYLIYLAIIVLGYNISINMTDVMWKEQLQAFFIDRNDALLLHMNMVSIGTGIVATIGGGLFAFMVHRLGWTFVGILTPLVMTVMAIGFFAFLFFDDSLSSFAMFFFGATPFTLTVYFGSLQNCLSKAGKYSVFDASKELAFLPLDQDSKLQGKSAIDGLGSAIGKSGASLTYQGLLIVLSTIGATAPYIAGILLIVLFAWMISVFKLGALFKKASHTSAMETASLTN